MYKYEDQNQASRLLLLAREIVPEASQQNRWKQRECLA
jgi:hypothetical protein